MSAAHQVRQCVRLKAVVQMAQWRLRLTTCEWVASRNTGVHVNILAASLHGPRLRQPSAPSVCTPKAAHHQGTVFLMTTPRSINELFYTSANQVNSTSLASNSERCFESGAVIN